MNTTTIYVKALSNSQWFGGWAPVQVRQEWLRPDGQAGLFTLAEQGLNEEDEYEYFRPGSLLIAVLDGEVFKVVGGVDAAALMAVSAR